MLEIARAKLGGEPELAGRVALIEADMRNFSLIRRFPLALIPARALQHVVEPEDQRRTLECVRRHLQPGGHLVVDLFDPNFEMLAWPAERMPVREARHPLSGNLVRRTVVERHNDPFRQVVRETLRLEEIDAAGRVVASEETSWALRWSLRQEMAYLFELCGFAVVAQYSDFRGSPPAYGREQLWIVSARWASPKGAGVRLALQALGFAPSDPTRHGRETMLPAVPYGAGEYAERSSAARRPI
jgi:hypothetical protein